MKIYCASEIAEKDISPPQMIVDELLPVGLSTLAGSPKLGKSWLVLSLAYSVAEGIPFLNHPTSQGDVLYVDVEGSPYRIKSRMETLGYTFPKTLQIAHEIKPLGEGLLSDIESWWSCAAFPRLIIIDTIGRVKSAGNKTLNAYENDSKTFAPLQKFAIEKQIAILCVTHLRKDMVFRTQDADWMERISGSMGLVGCCDAVWGLFRKRGESTGVLRTTARDVDAGDIVCNFDNGMWKFVSDNVDEYEFKQMSLVKFLTSITHFSGRADELCNKYLTFCKEQGIPHGLSENQTQASFGKQIKPLIPQGWRIGKSITRNRTKDGVFYNISTF